MPKHKLKKLKGNPSKKARSSKPSVYRVQYSLSTRRSYDWLIDSLQSKTVDEVLNDVGKASITHFRCKGKIPPFNILCPMVKYVSLENVPANCQLESMSSSTHIKMLWMEDQNFKKGLPKVVGALKSLTELHLQNCQLQDLPKSLFSLTQLKVLQLSYNNFKEGLPEVVGALKSLTELHLSNCQLQDLPESLSSLTQLKGLWLDGNNFEQGLPEVVGSLSSLTRLTLKYCQLQNLPESLSKLSQLEELNIKKNEFKEVVPEAVFHLTALTELDIRDNYELTKIDERVMALNKLQKLKWDGCLKLVSPPYGISQGGIDAIRKYFNAFRQGRKV